MKNKLTKLFHFVFKKLVEHARFYMHQTSHDNGNINYGTEVGY